MFSYDVFVHAGSHIVPASRAVQSGPSNQAIDWCTVSVLRRNTATTNSLAEKEAYKKKALGSHSLSTPAARLAQPLPVVPAAIDKPPIFTNDQGSESVRMQL